MAKEISEDTKIIVAQIKAEKEREIARIDREIAKREAEIDSLKEQRKIATKYYNALKQDIDDPTPVEPEPVPETITLREPAEPI